MDNAPNPTPGIPYGHLEQLLKENLDVAKENHKILKRMERNALIGFVFKAVIWLLVLGVPLYFLSTYFAPLLAVLTGGAMGTTTPPAGLFGLPSVEQMQRIIQTYQAHK